MRLLSGVIITLLLVSCAAQVENPPRKLSPESLTLLLQHGSLSGSEFEQFKVFGERIFYECGPVHSGRFTPDVQRIVSVDEKWKAEYESRASKVFIRLSTRHPRFEDAGVGAGFLNSGRFELNARLMSGGIIDLSTSINSVAEPVSAATRELNQLASVLRSSVDSEVRCKVDFYGITAY